MSAPAIAPSVIIQFEIIEIMSLGTFFTSPNKSRNFIVMFLHFSCVYMDYFGRYAILTLRGIYLGIYLARTR